MPIANYPETNPGEAIVSGVCLHYPREGQQFYPGHDRDEAANTDGGLGGGPSASVEAGFQRRNGASATDAQLESLRARARAVRVDGGTVWVNSSGERTENAAALSVAQLAKLSTWTQNASTATLYVHSDGSETIYPRNVAVASRSETNP